MDVKVSPAGYTPGSTFLTAESVTVEHGLKPENGDMVFVEGVATKPTATGFSIDGIKVDAGSQTKPTEGERVAVHGKYTDGVLMADFIQPAGASESPWAR